MARIEIKTDGVVTHVFMEGKEVTGIRKIGFSQEPGEVPILKLELVADKMSIDSPVLLELPDVYKPFYEQKKTEPLMDGSVCGD